MPALVALVVVAVGVLVIPTGYPVKVTDGKITPPIAAPTQKAAVQWTQDWRELCPVTITREFLGSDGFPKTAAPYELQPPKKTGVSPYNGYVTIPALPEGQAYYRSKIEPHCRFDALWQRAYYTPQIPVFIGQKMPPAGPR